VGDHDRDIQMAHNAGVPQTIRIRGDKPERVAADHTLNKADSLLPLLQQLL
jgi:heptosyltransferase-2/D-glycero-D-manno-heptose 1,7-bisphosphate phosphatase